MSHTKKAGKGHPESWVLKVPPTGIPRKDTCNPPVPHRMLPSSPSPSCPSLWGPSQERHLLGQQS